MLMISMMSVSSLKVSGGEFSATEFRISHQLLVVDIRRLSKKSNQTFTSKLVLFSSLRCVRMNAWIRGCAQIHLWGG